MRKNFIEYLGACALLIVVLLVGCDKAEPIVEEDLNGFDVRPDFKTATAEEIEAYMATPEMTQTPEADRLTDPAALDVPVGESVGSEDKPMFTPAFVVEARKEEGVTFTKRSGTVQLGIDPLDFIPGPSGPTYVVQQYSTFFGWFTIYVGDDDNVLLNIPVAWYPSTCQTDYYEYRVKAYDVTGCNEYEVVLSKIGCSGVIDRDYYSADDEDWIYFRAYTENKASCGFNERGIRPANCQANANMCAFSN